MKCKSCGEEIGDAKTCEKCGALQGESGETITDDAPAVDSASEKEGGQGDAEQNADDEEAGRSENNRFYKPAFIVVKRRE